ncbi:MAG TPA: ATP-binding protein [Blastocatellia bacterium]|nr:ATP-binding protein [Blastocatellia bacterium]
MPDNRTPAQPERFAEPNERISLKVPSDLQYLDGLIDYLAERMTSLGVMQPEETEVLVALDEAIVNAIKHGNKSDPRKAVQVVVDFCCDGARFTITDEGSGFVPEAVPDCTDPARLLQSSGRGLLLIHHIMDEVRHNHAGNEIQMFKRRATQQSPAPASEE